MAREAILATEAPSMKAPCISVRSVFCTQEALSQAKPAPLRQQSSLCVGISSRIEMEIKTVSRLLVNYVPIFALSTLNSPFRRAVLPDNFPS